MILMLAMKKNNIFTLSFHDISQYLNLTLSSSPIPFSSGPHFLRTLHHEPYLRRRHSDTVLVQSVGSLGPDAHKVV